MILHSCGRLVRLAGSVCYGPHSLIVLQKTKTKQRHLNQFFCCCRPRGSLKIPALQSSKAAVRHSQRQWRGSQMGFLKTQVNEFENHHNINLAYKPET